MNIGFSNTPLQVHRLHRYNVAVRMHAKDRALREKVYRAYLARASEFSQTEKKEDGKGDNAPLIEKILSLRLEKAKLLGYENFAEVSMAKKMAGMRGGDGGGRLCLHPTRASVCAIRTKRLKTASSALNTPSLSSLFYLSTTSQIPVEKVFCTSVKSQFAPQRKREIEERNTNTAA